MNNVSFTTLLIMLLAWQGLRFQELGKYKPIIVGRRFCFLVLLGMLLAK